MAQPHDSHGSIALDGVRLGFGTASLLGARGHDDAVRLVQAAVDSGIRYIDTARMYGSGGAEAAVGAAARGRRDRMVIATKVGILPPSLSLPAKVARKLAGKIGRQPPNFARPEFHVFDPARVRASVETSLRELNVDHIDVLLLHEVAPADVSQPLLALLAALKTEGKIGIVGLATEPAPTAAVARAHAELAAVAQIPHSLFSPALPVVAGSGVGRLGTHSIMGSRFIALAARLRADVALQTQWRKALDVDPADTRALGRLFLAEALDANPNGFVLFSSGDPANIAANARLAEQPLDRDRLARLRTLVQPTG